MDLGGGQRESYRSYLKRKLFTDPDAEAAERSLQRDADIAREARLSMRGTPSATRRGPSLPGIPSEDGARRQDGSVEVQV